MELIPSLQSNTVIRAILEFLKDKTELLESNRNIRENLNMLDVQKFLEVGRGARHPQPQNFGDRTRMESSRLSSVKINI